MASEVNFNIRHLSIDSDLSNSVFSPSPDDRNLNTLNFTYENGGGSGDPYLEGRMSREELKKLEANVYERYIRNLKDERENVQKKTFTKWVNSHLVRVSCRIGDLYVDLRDGRMLLKLLDVLSGERVPRPTRGKMRIHCLENVDKALTFLKNQRVHLENMGSHDIVDGNPRLTLGLIWTIILRFQIQDIVFDQVDSNETKSAKDALLLWCQMKTASYSNVDIRNFTTSWRDGLAFNAIIHVHRPDLIRYDQLSDINPIRNLNDAFFIAESRLGLTTLLDAEDVYVEEPDEKSIITYVVTYYHYFSKLKQETVHGKRIGKVVGIAMDNDRMIREYATLTSELLKWIEATVEQLGDRKFENSLTGVQQQLAQFNNYRTVEKPPRFDEKGELEVLLFTLQSKMRANNQKPYMPKEGKLISDINKAWESLEKAEHERELALRKELIRQEKLEQLAARFHQKAGMRETWLGENQGFVSQDKFGSDLPAVEAASKKHEAIETDIFAYEERVHAVVVVAQELEAENYHDIRSVNLRKDNVLQLWEYLLQLVKARRLRLEGSLRLQQGIQDMLHMLDAMEELKMRLLSDDYGKHLMGVEDLLQKHALLEADINVLGDRVKAVVQNSQMSVIDDLADPFPVMEKATELEEAYAELVKLAVERRTNLEESKQLWQFYWDMADEENWIKEKEHILSQADIGHDLTTIHLLLTKHKALEADIKSHEPHLVSAVKVGQDLVDQEQFGAEKVQERIQEIMNLWRNLKNLSDHRKNRLTEAVDYHQFFTDADDVDTWMLDNLRLASSQDVSSDEAIVQDLLRKHAQVTDELQNYSGTIDALHQQAEQLGERDRKRPAVVERLASIDRRYKELLEFAKLRKQRLLDALTLCRLFSEAETVEQWITEKESMLMSMVVGNKIEDVEILKHRYDGFENEMNSNASRIAVVNQLARQLLHVEHPSSEEIVTRQNQLNSKWSELREKAEAKREELQSAHGLQTFHIECKETVSWIENKKRILQETVELEMDLVGIMTLQRRLAGIERDVGAIQAKLEDLRKEAERIQEDHPEEAAVIQEEIAQIRVVWEELTNMLKERDSRLEEAGDLHRFLRDVDHFQAWLARTQTDIANEDVPTSLAEAEKLRSQHQSIKEEIDNYVEDYEKMMEYGERIFIEPSTLEDPQYMFLRERLKALKDGWEELRQMWDNRQELLSQSLNYQSFMRDANQAEVLLGQQEHILSKDEAPSSIEQIESLIKRHEALLTTMEANDEKINAVVQYASLLAHEGHSQGDKIGNKSDSIQERRDANKKKALGQIEKLREQIKLHQVLQDCEELAEWIQEKDLISQDDTYRSAKTVYSKWTRHLAFQAEIASNKDRLVAIEEAAKRLLQEKPEFSEFLEPKVEELKNNFGDLERNTKEKGEKLFDANRQVLYEQTIEDIDLWVTDLEKQIEVEEYGSDLTSVNILMEKQQLIETQMAMRTIQVTELESHAAYLRQMDPGKVDEIQEKKSQVEKRFSLLNEPLVARKQQVEKNKEAFQFRRDVEDEKIWISEKMPIATSIESGDSLYHVTILKNKNKSLQTETENHEARVITIIKNGQKLIDEGHNDSEEFDKLNNELKKNWDELKEAMEQRQEKLLQSEKAQQYLFDASEAEVWMSEQELYIVSEDTGRDESSAQNLVKMHETLENEIICFAEAIEKLGETARQLVLEEHPESDSIGLKQAQVDKLHADVKELATERRVKLEGALKQFMLKREVDDLLEWIAERKIIASSEELGQDYDHVTMLLERFKEFARITESSGNDRVARVIKMTDELIDAEHPDRATLAEWKEGLNEAWYDLLGMIDNRARILAASMELHKFFYDCKDVLSIISEKQAGIPEEVGRDAGSVCTLQRKHTQFLQDLVTLQKQVEQVQEDSRKLQATYAGAKATEIASREAEVVNAWMNLQSLCESRKQKLGDTEDLFKFFNMVRSLTLWMDDVILQMKTSEKPRDVGGVELLMSNHQSLKAEIDGREESFTACLELGRDLISRNHYAQDEIKEKEQALENKRNGMLHRWQERWEHLQLVLEIYQWARDAAVAEAWLIAQEPYLLSTELGYTIDEVDSLIKKHEAFEKSSAAQEERFIAIERLTTFEILDREKKIQEEEEERRKAEETANKSPPKSPKTLSEESRSPEPVSEKEITVQKPVPKERRRPTEEKMVEGNLMRKHEWESTTKKASNRSWDKLYAVLHGGALYFYKDQKTFKTQSEAYFRGEIPVDLSSAKAEVAAEYTKKKHVFRLKLSTGCEYLFQARDDEQMNKWIKGIQHIGQNEASGTGPSRPQTLPGSSGEKREEPKKRGFFSLKKK